MSCFPYRGHIFKMNVKGGTIVGTLKKVVTSAFFISGATALSSVSTEASELVNKTTSTAATELMEENPIEDQTELAETELIEKALRNFTNPLNRIHSIIEQTIQEDRIIYEVQEGDTLSGIGQHFDIPVAELVQENKIGNKHQLSIGQKLTIRLKELEYSVKYGETLEEITEQKGVTKEELIAYNPVLETTNFSLYPGQIIKLPTAPPEPVYQPLSSPRKRESIQDSKGKVLIASRSEGNTRVGTFSWPVSGSITSRYGTRWGRMHNGLDITNSKKTKAPIQAARAGVVLEAYQHRGAYGKLVIIDHGNGIQTYYAHLSRITVKEGDQLNEGDVLGYMGQTGRSTGVHLHFEVRRDNRPLNPLKYLK
jgi:murein DD-endopeptidase MepM/ murein hydrolase activator NlpD